MSHIPLEEWDNFVESKIGSAAKKAQDEQDRSKSSVPMIQDRKYDEENGRYHGDDSGDGNEYALSRPLLTLTKLAQQAMSPRRMSAAMENASDDEKQLMSLFDSLKTQWELANIVLNEGDDKIPKYVLAPVASVVSPQNDDMCVDCCPCCLCCRWVPDHEAPACQLCDDKFTLVRRRHHCR